MQIIDLTTAKEIKPLEKIQLVSCLQANANELGEAYFYESDYSDVASNFQKITRVVKKAFGDMDLIILERDSYVSVFLGYWNDGVI